MSIKFDIWMDRGDADALDTFARERGMTRSAESRYIIMDYLKNKAPYNIKEDPQVMELREAVISLNIFPYLLQNRNGQSCKKNSPVLQL